MTMYVIYVTNPNGDRVRTEMVYRTYKAACKAADELKKENPACCATPIKVMQRPNREYAFAD